LDYTGEAVNPTRLPLFERITGTGGLYNAAADAEARKGEEVVNK
jgi:hypothetical protein